MIKIGTLNKYKNKKVTICSQNAKNIATLPLQVPSTDHQITVYLSVYSIVSVGADDPVRP